MKQIYTKTGDTGQTSLRGGERVDKDDMRIEANGELDMLNSLIGLVRSTMCDRQLYDGHVRLLLAVQCELMTIMSHVATPDGIQNPHPLHCDELTQQMEQAIDAAQAPQGFVIPKGLVHVARAQCRTAERRLWTVSRHHQIDGSIMRMMNRLSDYLFVLTSALDS